jgi:hypothetical protein
MKFVCEADRDNVVLFLTAALFDVGLLVPITLKGS